MQSQPNNTRVKFPDNTLPYVEVISTTSNKFDRLSPNQKGRDNLSNLGKKEKLLSCRQYIHIETMNVRTLRTPSTRQELVDLSLIYGISIIGIVYHKLVHDEEIKLEKYTIVTNNLENTL